jgi:Zn-dependent protease with chaperone function
MMRAVLGSSLTLGALALAEAAATLLALALARAVRETAGHLGARGRASIWLALFLFPASAGLLAAALVAAAFIRNEPLDAREVPGPALVLAGAAGAALVAARLRKMARARRATRRFLAERLASARPLALPLAPAPVFCVRPAFPAVALVGLRRPRLLLAESALEALSGDELGVVLAHEAAHVRARDNFKGLLTEAAAWPLGLGAQVLRAWREAAEELADDRAARGSTDRALSLASALVKVARVTPPGSSLHFAATTLDRGEGFARRVGRLLTGGGPGPAREETPRPRALLLLLVALGGLGLAAVGVRALPAVHGILEEVVRLSS